MATLVLTAVGTAIGGPIGGAIGSIIGQQLDQNILFKPADREGPRLQELAVQTSSYGSQVPRIYGKMRVAGTVVWATDLKENRETQGGGKGRPRTTTYSYSACLAVALSSREIRDVGRIWADGKIFRGSAGDFKTETGFRLHTGGEDQSVDSLIASAEGTENTPAHRGLALAIFEDMDLTEYGNRIPSLTFEVIADDGHVFLAEIIGDISNSSIAATTDLKFQGFSAAGEDRRTALRPVVENIPMSFIPGPDQIQARQRQFEENQPVILVENQLLRNAQGSSDSPEYLTLPESKIARQYSIRYYEPERDYQSGMQIAFRPGQSRVAVTRDLPAAISPNQAKNIGQANLWLSYLERSTARARIAMGSASVRPSALLQMVGGSDIWQVRNWEFREGAIDLELSKAMDRPDEFDGLAFGGRSVADFDALAGATRLELVDLPFAMDAPMQVSDQPRLYAAATGENGWRNALLYRANEDGTAAAFAGQIDAPAVIGMVDGVLGVASPYVMDHVNSVEVEVHNSSLMLHDADDGQLLSGQNVAVIGAEILQFGFAEPLGETRYRLSRLIRGLGGTEAEISKHLAAEPFVLLDLTALKEIDLAHYSPFHRVSFAALGRDDDEPVIASIAAPGRALKPWSPVHPKTENLPNGDMEIQWVRRSRAGLQWLDNVEVPLAEESELYRVVLSSNAINDSPQLLETVEPRLVLSSATVQAYRSASANQISFDISQIGQFSLSNPLTFSVAI